MPVWHVKTQQWRNDGKLVLLGVTQEQHPERCRLFSQWKQFKWPILHDPINVLGQSAVPIVLAIDEHGIVRSTRPDPKTIEAEFLNKTFADDAQPSPASPTPKHPSDFAELKAFAKTGPAWRQYGDALALWGGEPRSADAIAAYRTATKLDTKDGPAWFRLGVCLRRRSEGASREPNDFREAVESWGTALDLDPNQYIWRRRIQQYGPRLEKPYPFYDWVPDAEAAIRTRGETPMALRIRPDGAEMAGPLKAFAAEKQAPKNPDADGKINRDPGSVTAHVVLVPAMVKPGQSARVHLSFHLAHKSKDHWNNEAEPLRVWVEPPDGTVASERLLRSEMPKEAVSGEERTLGFEVKIPNGAMGTVRVPAYAIYHLCDDDRGQCRLLRLDFTIVVTVKE